MPTREELLPRLAEAEKPLAPGAYWHYSNLAYSLLGEVVARVSGEPAEEYLTGNVLGPVGMTPDDVDGRGARRRPGTSFTRTRTCLVASR